jgi:hypothetical protein
MKGIIYYTSNRIKSEIKEGCWKQLQKANLPITVNNTPLPKIGALSMFHQILDCLERAPEKYVFFCEHDVLYHESHFDFTPPTDDTFYYNTNVWRWDYYSLRAVTYDHLASLSGLCVNRELAREFYKKRLEIIYSLGLDQLPTFGNPVWAREMGYEPGKNTKYKEVAKRDEWRSEFANIDIRHTRAMTAPKMEYADFVAKPIGWKEVSVNNIPGWDNVKSLVCS